MTDTPNSAAPQSSDQRGGIFARFIAATEIDTRLLGMLGAVVMIWIGFHAYGAFINGEGVFITPRNL